MVPSPQESVDNGPSLFDYGLDNLYNDLIDDFDPYLEYGRGYYCALAPVAEADAMTTRTITMLVA